MFRTVSGAEIAQAEELNVAPADPQASIVNGLYRTDSVHICSHKLAQPTVFIPVFPGTNCE